MRDMTLLRLSEPDFRNVIGVGHIIVDTR
jgi:hypothetical protein